MSARPGDRRSLAGWLSAALFVAVMLAAVTGSSDPLIRAAGGLALLAFVGVGGFLLARRPTVLGRLAVGLLAIGASAFLTVMVTSWAWGGGALNGRVEGGRYYLTEHGRETETSRARYWVVAVSETVAFVTWPLLFLIAAYNEHAEKRERARGRATRSDDAPRAGAGRNQGRTG